MADNACIYIPDPSLLGSKLFDSIGAIRSYQGLSEGDSATGIRFDIGVAEIQMNFMPPQQVGEHLSGFTGYVQSACYDKDTLMYALGRVNNVRFVLGCVIEPGFDELGKVEAFLLEFNRRLNGLLFIHNSVVDYDGEPLAGPLCDQKGT